MACVRQRNHRPESSELHGFLVHQQRKYVASVARDDEETISWCSTPCNPRPDDTALPLVRGSS